MAAEFCPPLERLVFATLAAEETDLPGIWAEPLEVVTEVLTRCATVEEVYRNLPDIDPGLLKQAAGP